MFHFFFFLTESFSNIFIAPIHYGAGNLEILKLLQEKGGNINLLDLVFLLFNMFLGLFIGKPLYSTRSIKIHLNL